MNNLIIRYYNLDFKKLKNISISDQRFKKLQKNDNKIINLPIFNITKDKKKLTNIINKINSFSNNKKIFIVLGTGGSNLGSKALINICQKKEKKKIYFYDNIDPVNFKNSIKKINLTGAGYIIISKSGNTPETLSQFGCIIDIFEKKKQLKKFFANCLIITDKKSSPLKKIAIKHKCHTIDHESEIGGRYSIFSNVGMVPAIIAGLDVKKIHQGAKYLLNNVSSGNYNEHHNLSNVLLSKNLLNKINMSVLMTYSDSLFYFGKWYLQLWAESIGKKGKGITPIHAVGTTDQHSQLQLYLDGPKDKFFTFITTNHQKKGLKINKKIFNEKEVAYLAGKSMGDLMQAEQQATIDTFIKNKFLFREIYIPIIDEFSIGQILAFSMLETITICNYLGVNPFNQPAVEQGKKFTKKYLIQYDKK